jgi:radical SAM superfamily enzyme YgiQ (UPF0313 family)
MKILLLSPNIKGIIDGVNRIQPPLGISYLCSFLKSNHDVFVRDTAIERWDNQTKITDKIISIGESDTSIIEYIAKINPHIVGISVLFSNLMDSAYTIANLIKQIDKRIVVIVGGNHVTNMIRDHKFGISQIININDVDFYFSGESEQTFPQFINSINSTEKCLQIPGVYKFVNGNLINYSKIPTTFMEMKSFPMPSWEYFNMEKYFSVGLFHSAQSYSNRVLPVMASRGCPEKCQFCTTPDTWGSKVRWRTPKSIYEEIKYFKTKYNIGEIQFQDDTLTANQKHLFELCDYLKNIKLPWCTPNGIKINYHLQNQYEMFCRMKESGCYQVTFACESGSQRVLDNIIRKNTNVSQFKKTIDNAKKAGLFVHSFWIVGFPGETFEEMNETIKVAEDSGADSFSLSILSPLPGTPIYHQVKKQNLWWKDTNMNQILFRNSLIKVDGFNIPEEFEQWVDEKNIFLNSILENTNPIRYRQVTENRGVMLKPGMRKIKQT